MKEKLSKSALKKESKATAIRIRFETQKRAVQILQAVNKKELGRKVKVDSLIELALSLVNDEHIKVLQQKSFTNEDRKELLRQKYISERGPISRDELVGFMLTLSRLMYLTAVSSHLPDGTRKVAFSKSSLCPCQHPWFLSAL